MITGGDFNIDMNNDSQIATDFDTIILSNGFVNVIKVPTTVTTESQTTLDLFITNCLQSSTEAGAISCCISDHLPIFLCVERSEIAAKKAHTIFYQNITEPTLNAFRNALLHSNYSEINNLNDANEAYNSFINIFKRLYSAHFPIKVRRQTRKIRKQWITPELRQEMKIRDQLYKKFLNTRKPDDLTAFKQYGNKVMKKLRSARSEFHASFLSDKNGRQDVLWPRLNTLLHRGHPDNTPLKLRLYGEELSGAELADAFNNFFYKHGRRWCLV